MLYDIPDWLDRLKQQIQTENSALTDQAQLSEQQWLEYLGDDFRKRKPKTITLFQKVLVTLVGSLYGLESRIRALLGRRFSSRFLYLYEQMTTEALALIKKTFGAVPIAQDLPTTQADGNGGLTVAMLLTNGKR